MATKLLVLLCVSFMLVSTASGKKPCVAFQVDPRTITPGVTDKLSFTCQLELEGYDVVNVAIMKDCKPIARMNIFENRQATLVDKIDGVTVKGAIGDSNPNITLDWTSPSTSAAGRYKCMANFLNEDASLVSDETEEKITLSEKGKAPGDKNNTDCPPSQCYADLFKDFINALKDLNGISNTSNLVGALTIGLQQMNGQEIRSQTTEMLWKDVMFKKSSPFNNKRYYLSRFQPTDAANAQSACESLGGYLAEIDDNSEYDFIRNFIYNGTGRIPQHLTILLGGTSESSEGTWVYRRSGKPIGVRDWAPEQPYNTNYGEESEKCQSLVAQDERAFRMNDVSCWITKGRSFYFLCEVPEMVQPY